VKASGCCCFVGDNLSQRAVVAEGPALADRYVAGRGGSLGLAPGAVSRKADYGILGAAYQFDWSHKVVLINGVMVTVKVAQVRLCHSRMLFVRAYPHETQEMVFDAHRRVLSKMPRVQAPYSTGSMRHRPRFRRPVWCGSTTISCVRLDTSA
jgi:hypothetical protein